MMGDHSDAGVSSQVLPWTVGAYAIVPKNPWTPSGERALLDAARSCPGLGATDWEVPFTGTLHSHDEPGFLRSVAASEHLTVTLIPGVMNWLATDPAFGLASVDASARRRAVEFTRDALGAVHRANDLLGRRAVRAVELHSAPGAARASAAALRESLHEIGEWNWQGAELLLEHCDACVPAQPSAKGFLALDDEIDVIGELNRTGHNYGLLVNWARSAIEARDAGRAVEHIEAARSAGLLRGFMFSGCSDSAEARGGAWADFHLPPAGADTRQHSLLDDTALAATFEALGDPAALAVFGMKVGAAPADTLAERQSVIRRSTSLIQDALQRSNARV